MSDDIDSDVDPSYITEIFPIFEEFLQPARFKIGYGGRGSAKTRQFVSILLNNVDYYGWRLVCFREVMKSIEDSVYQEFIAEIVRTGREYDFKILKKSIHSLHSGGEIKFDGLFRNQQKVKGYANFDAAWVEEAENVTAKSWRNLIPTLRNKGSEIWVSFNPDNPLSDTYQRFVSKPLYPEYFHGERYCITKKINYTDNPRFPQELRDDMELMKATDPELYQHVYLGMPVANSALAIIKPAWIAAAVDAHKKLDIIILGANIGGFDVADDGPDKNAFIARHGILVHHAEEWADMDPNSATRHVFNEALRLSVELVNFDDIGVGAGAKGEARTQKEKHPSALLEFVGFTASAAVSGPTAEYMPGKKNQDMFLNLKAQAWWLVADRFRNTYNAVNGQPYDPENLISLDGHLPHLDQLCAELAQPRREMTNGKIKVESKESLAKRGIKSPNLADALIMAFAPETGLGMLNYLKQMS